MVPSSAETGPRSVTVDLGGRLGLRGSDDSNVTGGLFLLAATGLCLVSLVVPGLLRPDGWRTAFIAIIIGLAVSALVVLRAGLLPRGVMLAAVLVTDAVIVLGSVCLSDRSGSRIVAALFALPSLYLGLYARDWEMLPQFAAVTAGSLAIMVLGGHGFTATAWTGTGAVLVSVFTPAGAVLVLRHRLVAALRRARALSTTDPLTGLANRRGLAEQAPHVVERARAGELALGVLVADVDHFKRINDRHGHAVGDQVLRLVAEAVLSCVRLRDVAVRLGGEEIAVLAAIDPAELTDLAERIRRQVAADTTPWPVTVSLGVAWAGRLRLDGDPLQLTWALVDEADDLMYMAKRAGRNRVAVPTLH